MPDLTRIGYALPVTNAPRALQVVYTFLIKRNTTQKRALTWWGLLEEVQGLSNFLVFESLIGRIS